MGVLMPDNINARYFDEAMRGRSAERTPDSIGGPLRVVPLDEYTREFFEDLPKPLVDFLTAHSYATGYTLGRLTFMCVNELRRIDPDSPDSGCLGDGLLKIGGGLNGDPIVVDLDNDLRMGFVCRDRLRSSRKGAARKALVDTGLDIGTFYLAAVLPDARFARDSYDAKRFGAEDWDRFRELTAAWMRGPDAGGEDTAAKAASAPPRKRATPRAR
jgi:hypothetical protein